MVEVEKPKLKLSCAAATAMAGKPYSSALMVTGGTAPYRFTITGGALPPGLALNPSSGSITGTPTTAGAFSYAARVTDAKAASATTSCSIKVTSSAPALMLSCASPAGELGSAYSSALAVSGGVSPYVFSISAGSLPSGLVLSSATGAVTGTPTASGTFSYTGKVVDAAGSSATTSCSIAVSAPLKLSCASSAAQVGSSYASALSASGGVSPYTFSITAGSLPPGLTLNASTGAITGTPTKAGSYNYTAEATDKSGTTATTSCTISPTTVGSCLATSSLTILAQGSSVTAYVPDGSWSAGTTGIQVVPVEPPGPATSIATPNVVNSCAANSSTGQTVCTANNTDVYLLTGTTLNTTLTSGANARAGFSGGSCENCGVAINPTTNTAVITMGLSGAPSGSALQYLDLGNNTFSTPVPASHEVSEDVLWDPTRNLILSPDEQGVYDLFQVASAGTSEYGNAVSFGEGDSAAEDCSTGIALSSIEFTTSLYIADLSQATFTAGTPGTWSAPQQVQTFPEFSRLSDGTNGIAVAGNSHLGIVTGEYGGNALAALQLPAASGSGTPAVTDYAAAVLPSTPDGNAFAQGRDPHTVTAYVSPNNGKAYAVMANGYAGPPTYLAVIDIQALLNAPRTTGTHTVDPAYDLLANHVVAYVPAQ